jgi:hypothetical protein
LVDVESAANVPRAQAMPSGAVANTGPRPAMPLTRFAERREQSEAGRRRPGFGDTPQPRDGRMSYGNRLAAGARSSPPNSVIVEYSATRRASKIDVVMSALCQECHKKRNGGD